MDTSINFPNIGLYFENIGKSITIFGFEIAYYGMAVALGMLVGVMLAYNEAKKTGQNAEQYIDVAMVSISSAIVGARLYYVIFSWQDYQNNLLDIFNLRKGGLAIYGGVIMAVFGVYIFSKIKKLSFWQLVDTACIGLVMGQIIGRWGNFFNREAFGGYTDSIFAMQLPYNAVYSSDITLELASNLKVINGIEYIQVHPTFLYEMLWNVGVFIILMLYKKRKKFAGEVFMLYLAGYGLGRAWIEGLRTDQLLLFGVPVSQALAIILLLFSTMIIVSKRRGLKNRKQESKGD
jgi:prolipoprotein diacylglyceryl transferase